MKKITSILKAFYERGAIHIFAGSFLTKLVAFFGSIFLVRVLSKHDYGILGYLENIYSYIFVFAGMGMSNAILRYVVLGRTMHEKYSFYSYMVKKGVFWNLILIVFAWNVMNFYPHPEIYKPYIWLLKILILSLPFQYITDNILCNERAMFENQRFAKFSLLLSLSVIVVKIVSGSFFGIEGVIVGLTLLYVFLAVLFYKSCQKKYYSGFNAVKLAERERREICQYAFQYMITNGLWAIFMLNDTFLLGRFGGIPEAIADYKVAYTIPGSVSLISAAIGIFVAPYFVKNETDMQWIRKNYFRTCTMTALFVGGLCAVLALFANPVIKLLYGEQYLNIAKIMRILLLASFFNCGLRYTTANILAAMGQVKYNMIVSIIGMVLQLGINIKVIPVFGAEGVAITSCVVYALMAVLLLIIFINHYYIKKN